MNNEHRFEIDDVTYVMTPANAMAAWNSLKRAGVLLRDVEVGDLKQGDGSKSVALGAILGNLGDPAVADIESLVFEQTAVKTADGGTYRLSSDQLNKHFNARRAHVLRVLIEGVKYQYGDFFAGGMAAFKEMLPMPNPKAV